MDSIEVLGVKGLVVPEHSKLCGIKKGKRWLEWFIKDKTHELTSPFTPEQEALFAAVCAAEWRIVMQHEKWHDGLAVTQMDRWLEVFEIASNRVR